MGRIVYGRDSEVRTPRAVRRQLRREQKREYWEAMGRGGYFGTLGLLAFLLPPVGLLMAIIWLAKDSPDARLVGRRLLNWSLAWPACWLAIALVCLVVWDAFPGLR